MPSVLRATVVISNASPLIALRQIGHLPLLELVFGLVLVPPAVEKESRLPEPWPPFLAKQRLFNPLRLEVVQAGLDPGETEALCLALEVNARLLLLDDRAARSVATSLGVPVMGTLGVIFTAKQKGIVHAVRPLIESLKDHGFRVAPRLYEHVLRDAGEIG